MSLIYSYKVENHKSFHLTWYKCGLWNLDFAHELMVFALLFHILLRVLFTTASESDPINNSLALGDVAVIPKQKFSTSLYRIFAWILTVKLLWGECHRTSQCEVNIGPRKGLVPSGNMPLPEPILTKTYFAILCYLIMVVQCTDNFRVVRNDVGIIGQNDITMCLHDVTILQ